MPTPQYHQIFASADTDSAQFYQLQPVLPDHDYLDEIIDEILNIGQNTVTSQALSSSRQTLLIQRFADGDEVSC